MANYIREFRHATISLTRSDWLIILNDIGILVFTHTVAKLYEFIKYLCDELKNLVEDSFRKIDGRIANIKLFKDE
jgi:hypothetical protein